MEKGSVEGRAQKQEGKGEVVGLEEGRGRQGEEQRDEGVEGRRRRTTEEEWRGTEG